MNAIELKFDLVKHFGR